MQEIELLGPIATPPFLVRKGFGSCAHVFLVTVVSDMNLRQELTTALVKNKCAHVICSRLQLESDIYS